MKSHPYNIIGLYAEVKEKCYSFSASFDDNNPFFHVYNRLSESWEALPSIPKVVFEFYAFSKVYNNRWILLHLKNEDFTAWNFWIFDTHDEQWTETRQFPSTPRSLGYCTWVRDKFLHCECNCFNRGCTCPTRIYDISYFLPNWYVIYHLVLLRQLIDTGRAHCTQNTCSELDITAQKLMIDLDLDTFRTVLSYLLSEKEL